MNHQIIDRNSNNQLKALKRFFVLAALCFAFLLVIQAISLSRIQLSYQQALMQSVSQSILKELTQELATQKLKMSLFYSNNKPLINSFIKSSNEVTEEQYLTALNKVKNEFPKSRLYTLISPKGTNLLEHITGTFLDDCSQEVTDTVKEGEQKKLFLHRSKSSTHYDLIQRLDLDDLSLGYFFVAFNIDFFNELLKKYQLPYQQLYLLRNDKQGFIEVSSQTESYLQSTQYLDKKTMANFEHALEIPNTRWSFAIRLDPEAKSQLLNTALMQSFITWSVVTILLLLALQIIKRNLQSKYRVQQTLEQSRKNAFAIINAVNEAVISIDALHTITYANQSAALLFKKTNEELLEQNISNICTLRSHTINTEQNFSDILSAAGKNLIPDFSNLTLHLISDDSEVPVAIKIAPIVSDKKEINGYAVTLENLSTAVELSKRMVFHEKHDKLTGLFNRQQLENNIESNLQRIKNNPENNNASIILIDFDKFKLLNSSHGFEAGDEFLKRVAKLFRESLAEKHPLYRISSDEFAVILTNTEESELQNLSEQIKQLVRDFKFEWNQEIISTSVCLGIVIIDQHFNHSDEIFSAADHACRLAKSKGINITQYYQTDDPDIQQRTEEINILTDLKKAIDEERLALYRQEIRAINQDLDSSSSKKYELLIRMYDEQGNIISPVQFIPAAEKYGLMAKIDYWVIRNTFKQISVLSDNDSAIYSINISSKTLSDKKIISFVEGLFKEFPIEASRVNFEVTETSAISYLDNALDFMQAMQAKGCTFSLDDFGTGLASFDYLRKLPIDFLKIDGVFVREIESNPNDFAFIEAIHKISSQMGIKTVAEFVENSTILKMLGTIGVDYAQGYHIHKPELWFGDKPEVH